MIIIDTNVLTHLVLKGDHSQACEQLYQKNPEWAAPRLWRDELANVLATYERLKLISRKDALSAFADIESIIGSNEFDIRIERILTTSEKTGCSGYDSQYISLAEDLNLPLYTYDKKVLKAVPHIAVKPSLHN